MNNYVTGEYYCGNRISDYGIENGFVDYRTFAKSFNAVLCNDVFEVCEKAGDYSIYDNLVNYGEDEDGNEPEVFQWFIVDDSAKYELDLAGEVYTYSDLLGCYIWGVTHFGTSWDYVLTNIRCCVDENEED